MDDYKQITPKPLEANLLSRTEPISISNFQILSCQIVWEGVPDSVTCIIEVSNDGQYWDTIDASEVETVGLNGSETINISHLSTRLLRLVITQASADENAQLKPSFMLKSFNGR